MDLVCEERLSDSPLVELVWRSQTETENAFTSIAESHYSLVVTRYRGTISLTVRGPETRATPAYGLADMETFGILFKPGVFFSEWAPQRIMDRNDITLPGASANRFWLKGSAWQFPDFDNADTFVSQLVRSQMLVYDPVVDHLLMERIPRDMSLRTMQRRFVQATGMTRVTMHQINRARLAASLLTQGTSILDTIYRAGYYDQPHLTRSLKAYTGFTPAQLLSTTRTSPLSFLYKNVPLHLGDTEVVAHEGEQRWQRQHIPQT